MFPYESNLTCLFLNSQQQEQSMLSYQGSRMQGVQAILTYLTVRVFICYCDSRRLALENSFLRFSQCSILLFT
jgi:hypothetical protein